MAAILTAEDVVRRIAAECAYVNERGVVGIRLEPAAAIVRRYGKQFRPRRRKPLPCSEWSVAAGVLFEPKNRAAEHRLWKVAECAMTEAAGAAASESNLRGGTSRAEGVPD
jgi:hypothetical protein